MRNQKTLHPSVSAPLALFFSSSQSFSCETPSPKIYHQSPRWLIFLCHLIHQKEWLQQYCKWISCLGLWSFVQKRWFLQQTCWYIKYPAVYISLQFVLKQFEAKQRGCVQTENWVHLQWEPKKCIPTFIPLQVLFLSLYKLSFPWKKRMLTSCDIFSPAATIAYTRSAERKQSGYCVPLEWPAPILRAPTPPTMTTRGIDVHCHCIRASAILWSPEVVPCPSLISPWFSVLVMTESDILSDIGLLWTSHHGSEVVGVK